MDKSQPENENRFQARAGDYPVKLITRTPEKWIKEFCENGDLIKIVVLQDGSKALLNVRTNNIYFFSEAL